jgi:hypothetical protein
MSPLEKHIAYFSKEGQISYDSMRDKLLELGETKTEAEHLANIVSFVGGVKIKYCPYRMFQPKEAVGVLNHARDTSIYKLDGEINEDQWKKLCEYSEEDEGIKIITEKRFYEFLKFCRDNDARWDVLGIAKKASDGEWKDFFRFCTDHWKKSSDGSEASVTLGTLRKFYENTPEVFDEVVNKHLPVAKPTK